MSAAASEEFVGWRSRFVLPSRGRWHAGSSFSPPQGIAIPVGEDAPKGIFDGSYFVFALLR